jgi:hypothetical protein
MGGPNGEMYGILNGDGSVTPNPSGGYYTGFGPGSSSGTSTPNDPAPGNEDSSF